VNKDGYVGRRAENDIVVAMNPASFARDLASVASGGAFYYADDIKLAVTRDDISVYAMPVKEIVKKDPNVPSDFRDLVGNMVYVGVLAQMLGIDLEKIRAALDFHFKGKQKPIDMNFNTVKAGAEWARTNLKKTDPFAVEAMSRTEGLIMADGNTAAAIGAIFGGVQFAAWYPITPASSLAEALNEYLPELRKREDGKHTYAVVQAEDELAAIGMAIGAGWSGLRAMTSTSGPGLSLDDGIRPPGLLHRGAARRMGRPAHRTLRPACPRAHRRRPHICELPGSRRHPADNPAARRRG